MGNGIAEGIMGVGSNQVRLPKRDAEWYAQMRKH